MRDPPGGPSRLCPPPAMATVRRGTQSTARELREQRSSSHGADLALVGPFPVPTVSSWLFGFFCSHTSTVSV